MKKAVIILLVIIFIMQCLYSTNIKMTNETRLKAHEALFASGLASMITGFTGAIIGALLLGAGYHTYCNLEYNGTNQWEFTLYYNMYRIGFFMLIISGSLFLLAIIPFTLSFGLLHRKKRKIAIIPELSVTDNRMIIGLFMSLSS